MDLGRNLTSVKHCGIYVRCCRAILGVNDRCSILLGIELIASSMQPEQLFRYSCSLSWHVKSSRTLQDAIHIWKLFTPV